MSENVRIMSVCPATPGGNISRRNYSDRFYSFDHSTRIRILYCFLSTIQDPFVPPDFEATVRPLMIQFLAIFKAFGTDRIVPYGSVALFIVLDLNFGRAILKSILAVQPVMNLVNQNISLFVIPYFRIVENVSICKYLTRIGYSEVKSRSHFLKILHP